MDDIRPGLKLKLRGRRGLLCRVVEGGTIRRGDRIDAAAAERADRQIQSDATAGTS
jgi:MOSC domain-containing protein YiiM